MKLGVGSALPGPNYPLLDDWPGGELPAIESRGPYLAIGSGGAVHVAWPSSTSGASPALRDAWVCRVNAATSDCDIGSGPTRLFGMDPNLQMDTDLLTTQNGPECTRQ